jgi:DNA (cytosine-5)-methyltransferase 1
MKLADHAPDRTHSGMPQLTVEMAALLQGFPADWKIAGRKTAAYRQVGNAFPAPVAEAIGRAIGRALLAHTKARDAQGLSDNRERADLALVGLRG